MLKSDFYNQAIKVTNQQTSDNIYIERVKRGVYVAHCFNRIHTFDKLKRANVFIITLLNTYHTQPLLELKELASGLYHFDLELPSYELLYDSSSLTDISNISDDTRQWLQAISKQTTLFKNGMDTKLQEIFITNDTKELLQLI